MKNESILIFDDKSCFTDNLAENFKNESFIVRQAEHSSDLYEITDDLNIDIIFISINKINDNPDIIRSLRKLSPTSRFVALYDKKDELNIQDFFDFSLDDFIEKDSDFTVLLFKSRKLLEERESSYKLTTRFNKATNYLVDHIKEFELNKSVYKSIFNNVSIGLVIINNERKVVDINPTARNWLSSLIDDESDIKCYKIMGDDHSLPCMECPLNYSYEQDNIYKRKIKVADKVIKIISQPLLANNNQVHLTVSILEDITEEENAREILRNEIIKNKKILADYNPYSFQGMTGKSPLMEHVFTLLRLYADSNLTILVEGETGTGKELVAKALHDLSTRSGKMFMPVHCGAIPEDLLETQLFGHVKGSFTSAYSDKAGILETAKGGTVFLDEIECASPRMQAALLRVIENQEYTPVGSSIARKTDIRVICASNINLEEQKNKKRFREDLFYRISGGIVTLPPLRERKEDIFLLVNEFLIDFEKTNSKPAPYISGKVVDLLAKYSWPGNIRELKNLINNLGTRFSGKHLKSSDLPENIFNVIDETDNLNLKAMEKNNLIKALEAANGNKTKAAEFLGIARKTIYELIKKHHI